MTKSIVKGYSPVSSETELLLDDMQYAQKFSIVHNVAGNATITNMDAPLGYPETVRFSASDINNVYKDTKIANSLRAPTTRGRSVVVSLRDVWREVDSTDATYEVALPMKAHLVLTVPNNSTISDADIQAFVIRMISCAFDAPAGDQSRLMELLKGSLIPSEM